MVVESTSFDKQPVSSTESVYGIENAIKKTFANGGSVVIPSLSQRGPVTIEVLHNLRIKCRKYIDGPLLVKILETYTGNIDPNKLTRNFGEVVDYYQSLKEAMARFDLEDVTVINSHQESVALSERLAQSGERAIVIAGGGMGTGRAVNYIKGPFAQNPNNSIIFTCYQVPGTLGAEVTDQENKNLSIKSKIYHFGGFTSHVSGEEETFDNLERYNLDDLEMVVIGHGKDIARRQMAKGFERRSNEYVGVIAPRIRQVVTV
jgi:predicted metal-dependent RNase